MMDQLHETIHHSRDTKEAPRDRPDSPRRRMSRAHSLLAPRPYEEIYHEQAYLATYLQQKTQRIESIIKEYSGTQAQLERGAEGKTRRRLRKLLNLLRCKLDEASAQERAIFSRMGELYMELNSRDTWERTRSISADADAAHSTTTQHAAGSSQAGVADEECGVTPVTPCPSFVSSDGSVASSAALASPEPAFAPVFVNAGVPDDHHPYALPAPEYLEPVPEETEVETKKTPAAPMGRPEESGQRRQENRSGPEIGILEYHYVHDETGEEDEDKGGKVGDEEQEEEEKVEAVVEEEAEEEEERETSSRPSSKDRSHRFSLPVMQFTWPD
ncbi:hypothetical protein MY11210_002903 [Beauveria gryllotalpidicola]